MLHAARNPPSRFLDQSSRSDRQRCCADWGAGGHKLLHWWGIWILLPHVGFGAQTFKRKAARRPAGFLLVLACPFGSQLMEAKSRIGLHALVALVHGMLQLCAHRWSQTMPLLRAQTCGLEHPEGAGSLRCQGDPTNQAPAQPAGMIWQQDGKEAMARRWQHWPQECTLKGERAWSQRPIHITASGPRKTDKNEAGGFWTGTLVLGVVGFYLYFAEEIGLELGSPQFP